jgi:hypothetical protein
MYYRIEIRKDIDADSDDEALRIAQEEANKIGGEVTAVFDENWDEL